MSAVANENFLVENWRYLLAALAMHGVLVWALTITIDSTRQTVIPSQLAIKAVMIDNTSKRIKREQEQAHTRATLSFTQEVLRDAELLVTGAIRVACLDATSHRPRGLPENLAEKLSEN